MTKPIINQSKPTSMKSLFSAVLAAGLAMSASVQANTEMLKVCAATDEMPYSNQQQQGFENELAQVLAKEMGRELQYEWLDKAAIFLVTEKLLKNECDVVMGVDSDDPRVATSNPYYKSGYAFIYPANEEVNIQSWQSNDLKSMNKFAVVPGSPSEVMLREIDKYEGNFNYTMSLIGFKSRRNQYVRYDPDMMVSEVVNGKADIAHLWAPEAARYVKSSPVPLKMVLSEAVAPTNDGEGVKQHFAQSIAVRTEDTALLKEINTALQEADSEIEAILKKEGVPLL